MFVFLYFISRPSLMKRLPVCSGPPKQQPLHITQKNGCQHASSTHAAFQTIIDDLRVDRLVGSWALRWMQNSIRLDRWQLYQEAGPQQAKGVWTCESCPDASRQTGGNGWSVGWDSRKASRRWKLLKGETTQRFGLLWTSHMFLMLYFRHCWGAVWYCCLETSPLGQLIECTQPSGVPGCLFVQQ